MPLALPTISDNTKEGFFQGIALPLMALGFLLRRPRLWPLIIIPLIVNVLLLATLIGWGFSEFAILLTDWLEGAQAWYWSALRWIAKVLFVGLILFVVYFIFTPLALLIAAPFNDFLAEEVEHSYGFAITDNRPWIRRVFGEAFFAVVSGIKRLTVALSVLVLLLALNLIPFIGIVLYVVFTFIWTCWCAVTEFTGYAADRRHLGLGKKWMMMSRHWPISTGFGLMCVGFMMIPFVNALLVPISAVGGTILFGMLKCAKVQN